MKHGVVNYDENYCSHIALATDLTGFCFLCSSRGRHASYSPLATRQRPFHQQNVAPDVRVAGVLLEANTRVQLIQRMDQVTHGALGQTFCDPSFERCPESTNPRSRQHKCVIGLYMEEIIYIQTHTHKWRSCINKAA